MEPLLQAFLHMLESLSPKDSFGVEADGFQLFPYRNLRGCVARGKPGGRGLAQYLFVGCAKHGELLLLLCGMMTMMRWRLR